MTQTSPSRHVVLYADDDADDLMLIQEAFSNHTANIDVVTATNGEEALAYLHSLTDFSPTPCLIILDINMPRLNGKETLKEIRNHERFADTPVVMFSTSSLANDLKFAEKYKANFITKPIDIRQMSRITEQFMEHCTDDIRKRTRRS